MGFNVAIDGPAGAGKSTVAKAAAARGGLIYVDTGAMYRAIGLYLIRQGISLEDEDRIGEALPDIDVGIRYVDGVQKIILNGEDVSSEIRTQEVGEAASVTSAYRAVREKLLDLQRSLAAAEDVIMDGRDIGTNILPKADVKIYLTAATAVRAGRRYKELIEKGQEADFETVEAEIIARDKRDMEREIAPLKKADDAIVVDTSYMDISEATEAVLKLIREKKEEAYLPSEDGM